MNRSIFRSLISVGKYLITLGIAGFLLWYVYKDLDFREMLSRFGQVNYYWIILSFIFALLSHYLRAYRWNLLLEPVGYQLKTSRTFLAVMTGYFANLMVPRMGEVTKCGVLKKTDGVAMTTSIGSVVTERVVDLLCLFLVAFVAFMLEFDKLNGFVMSYFEGSLDGYDKTIARLIVLVSILIFLAVAIFIFLRIFKQRIKRNPLFIKIRHLLRSLVEGMLSIRKLKNTTGFWISTILIWVLYYLMSYVVFFSIAETSGLSWLAGLIVLLMGGVAMATPVQGGIGPYHLLVSGALLLYGIGDADGKFFAFLLHTSQFLLLLVTGAIGFVLSLFLKKRDAYVGS
ncbi:MAG: lysylphosphatidylglycerol synthase transmembrane domain-containing protein [Cyclobacteriaceae bacterium]